MQAGGRLSKAVGVFHGAFGRVCLYALDRSMVSHAHREGHLLFHVEGDPGEVWVDGRAIPLEPGRAVAVNPWQQHHFQQRVRGGQTLALVLYISQSWFRNATGSERLPLRFGRADIAVSKNLERLATSNPILARTHDETAINDWLLAVAHDCFQSSWLDCGTARHGECVRDFRLRKAIHLLEHGLREPLDLDTVAREAGLSRPHFYKLFRQQVGVTPNIYLNSLRMECAIERLTATSEAVSTIGLDLGFSSQASFTRFFIANGVVPPSDYRRTAQAASQG
jgi:AraC-like DNA-binding protein/mannose-6-phosphate isomerase-like protein (cupin superfamily)